MSALPIAHRFRVGQRVTMLPGVQRLSYPNAEYEVARLLPEALPSEGGGFRYVLRDVNGGHERVVLETQITL